MSNQPTRRELARQRAAEIFTGRHQALEDFQRNLELSSIDTNCKLVWTVFGEGGLGKTTLLRRYRAIVIERKYLTAWVDEYTQPSIVSVMGSIAEEVEKQGHILKSFAERYKVYRQHKSEIEADPERPTGFAKVLGHAGGRVGVQVLKQVPVAGDLAVGLLGEEWMVEKTSEFAEFVARKVGNKDEVRLVLEPVEVLTPLFVESLSQVAEQRPIALFFDTYEKTSPFLDGWLRDVLEGNKYGELSLNVLLIIGGRYELGPEWLNENIQPFIERIRLEPFTDEEAREYLAKRGVTDETAIEIVLKLSGRIPVLLATLTSQVPDAPNQMGDPTGEAIDRFLKWVGDEAQREAILTCALPRAFNRDVARVLLGEEQGDTMFGFMKSMDFVSQRMDAGWVYHEVVRRLMLRQHRLESLHRWQEIHLKLATYYAAQRDSLRLELEAGLEDARWQHCNLEWLYHSICEKGRSVTGDWVDCLLDALRLEADPEYCKKLGAVVREAGEALEERDIATSGRQIIDGVGAWDSKQYKSILPMLDILVEGTKSSDADKRTLAFFWRGIVRTATEDYTAALADFKRTIELQPQDGLNYLMRGITYEQLQDYTAAIADFNRAIELRPQDVYAYQTRGRVHRKLGNHSAALEDFNRAIELQSEEGSNYFWRGLSYEQLQNYPAALADFTHAILLKPHDAYNYQARGRVHHKLGNHSAALEDMSHAIELQPEEDGNYYQRGSIYEQMQNYHAALTDFTRAIELQPHDGYNFSARGRINQILGEATSALEDFTRAIELQPHDSNNYWCRGCVHDKLENYPAALTDFTRAIELQPHNGNNYWWRGHMHDKLENYPAALTDFTRAIELQPHDGYNYLARGEVHDKVGDHASALVDFTRAIELQPQESHNYSWRGFTHTKLENYPAALADFTRAIELQPNDARNYTNRGRVHQILGNIAASLEDFSRASELEIAD